MEEQVTFVVIIHKRQNWFQVLFLQKNIIFFMDRYIEFTWLSYHYSNIFKGAWGHEKQFA